MFSIKNTSARQHTIAGVTINPGKTHVLSFDDKGYESKIRNLDALKKFAEHGELVIADVSGDYEHGDEVLPEPEKKETVKPKGKAE